MSSTWNSGRFNVTFGATPAARPAGPAVADPAEAARWGAEGDRLRLAGEVAAADHAYARQMRATVADPELLRAADALVAGRPAEADALLRAALPRRPSDPLLLWMAGDVASRGGRNGEAERLLARCLDLSPAFVPARYAYAMVLTWLDRVPDALAQAGHLLAAQPGNALYRHLQASSLLRLGEEAAAADAYAAVLEAHPDQPLSWMSYGHVLKTLGRQAEAVAAYRRCLALDPRQGEAWWSLANLKTVRFGEGDLAAMRAALARSDLSEPDRLQLHFALGKGEEDAGRYAQAFDHYAQGNAMQRARLDYDAGETTSQMRRTKALLGRAFFAARAGQGAPRPDPIFIVGLPRSGSTLVEQILASHSLVEGTQELDYMPAIAARLAGGARRPSEGAYPDVLAALSPAELASLGEEYLARAATHRKLGRPFFIDKLPNNFAHAGLIHLILPNAKIVDVRRHPLGCCLSGFKQHFAAGQPFTYDLADIGRYYADYVELMAHFDAALPGRIHRVLYERLVADPEGETRALLQHCGLDFEPACLRFYENRRAVRTASSEQVRQPIFTDAADHWRHFDPWLGPLKLALGPALDGHPEPGSI
ncbi:tetratricopeptide repeat-containing sulfotransferase family protein [Phenylobacterium sp.]|uniref:tetratricopeptide repeat-containing sulfotransferase family protein n=1 Tax=Phenylobacterium sp. TaxID=1871053 RepID=UPI0025CF2343|nr:tetratricopeptide repeat-containing sulfotransferase family protein [Phenylobacterium sp.]